MKLLHISDTHGKVPTNNHGADIIVHSGDLFPNYPSGALWPDRERSFQEQWLRETVHRWRDFINNATFVYCSGNHDFYSPEEMFTRAGLDCADVTNRGATVKGLNFYGFPYVNAELHPWNWAVSDDLQRQRLADVQEELDTLERQIDVLVSHSPPKGVLDQARSGNHYGSTALREWLDAPYTSPPSLLLCGHIHEQGGTSRELGMPRTTVYNSAQTRRLIDLEPYGLPWVKARQQPGHAIGVDVLQGL